MSAGITRLVNEVRALRGAIHDLKANQAAGFCFRNDRDAGRYVGINSPWRFNLWAIKHGLKPKMKASRHARTVYLRTDLEAAVLKDKAKQFEAKS